MAATGTARAERTDAQAAATPEAIEELIQAAVSCVAEDRPKALILQWLGRARGIEDDDDEAMLRVVTATSLALHLTLFQPSASGQTAFDRYARSRGRLPPEAVAALQAVRRYGVRVAHVESVDAHGDAVVRDRHSGERLRMAGADFPAAAAGCDVIAMLTPIADAWHVLGPVTPLDAAGLAVADGFAARGGRGLANPLRCLEAVYRHVVRNGTVIVPGLNVPSDEAEGPFPLDPGASDHDALAFAWAEHPADRPLPHAELERARAAVGGAAILDVIRGALTARAWGRERLADGYARVLSVQLETLVLRKAAGVAGPRLDEIRAVVAALAAQGAFDGAALALFDSVVAKLPRIGGQRAPDSDLEKLIQRIRALRAKTVEQGCTEQEALAAAEKVAELLDRYGLSLSELELRKQSCEGVGIETGRRRAGPLDDCTPSIAAFFDCRTWMEQYGEAPIRHIFFGLPADVAAARYLYELVERAFDTETAAFKAGLIYAATPSGRRRGASTSFQHGMAIGICRKLDALRTAREAVLRSGSGRDLVPVKAAMLEEDLQKLGLSLTTKQGRGRTVQRDAYSAGQEAGERFDYTPGIAHRG